MVDRIAPAGVPPPAMTAHGGELCSLGNLVQAMAERAHHNLEELGRRLATEPDEGKRQHELLKYLHGYRQQMLRLLTVVSFLQRRPESANAVMRSRLVMDKATRHQAIFQETADKLFFLWRDELQVFRAPIYDVPTALEVFTTGTYTGLPTCVEDLRGIGEPLPAERRAAARRMDMQLRCCLLDASIPKGLNVVKTEGGVTTLRAAGRYEVGLTLVPKPKEPPAAAPAAEEPEKDAAAAAEEGGLAASRGIAVVKTEDGEGMAAMEIHSSGEEGKAATSEHDPGQECWRWCLVDITILPGSTRACQLTSFQGQQLRQAIQARMWAAADKAGLGKESDKAEGGDSKGGPLENQTASVTPLALMHRILCDVSARMLIDNLVTTARAICQPGAGLLRVDPLTGGGRSGVVLTYWPDVPVLRVPAAAAKAEQSAGPGGQVAAVPPPPSPPHIEIELGEGTAMALHRPALVDAFSGVPVNLAIDPVAADSEQLLLSAASAYALLQLYALHQELNTPQNHTILRAVGGSVELKRRTQRVGHCGGDPRGGLALPCIEMSAEGVMLLVVQIQLKTGKLVLRPGEGLGGEGGMDFTSVLKVEEGKLQEMQAHGGEIQPPRRSSSATPAFSEPLRGLSAIVYRLLNFFHRLALRDFLAQLMVACRTLRLQCILSPPRHLYEACLAAGGRGPSYYLAFPPIPLPPGFPLNKIPRMGSSMARTASQLLTAQLPTATNTPDSDRFAEAISLRFYLGVDTTARMTETGSVSQPSKRSSSPRYALFVSSGSMRGVALQALRRISVPASALERGKLQRHAALAAGKRKREEGENEGGRTDLAEEAMEAGALEVKAADGGAAGQQNWGRELMEELAGAVEWSRKQILWELLRVQLDALQVAYAEEVVLEQQPEMLEDGTSQPALPAMLGRKINLLGPKHATRPLPHERVVLEAGENSSSGVWRTVIYSPYLPGLTKAALPGSPPLPLRPGERPMEKLCLAATALSGEVAAGGGRTEGYAISYSLAEGHSLVDSLVDIERVLRTADIVRRVKGVLESLSSKQPGAKADVLESPLKRSCTTPQPGAKPPGLKPVDSLSFAAAAAAAALVADSDNRLVEDAPPFLGCGQVRLTGAGLVALELVWVPPRGEVPALKGGPHSDSRLGVGPLKLRLDICSSQELKAAATRGGTPTEFQVPHLECRVTSEPPVLASALRHLGRMVMDGEEGLAVDALRCMAAPLIVLAQVIIANRLPCRLIPSSPVSPYTLDLLLQPLAGGGAARHRLLLRFYARGLVSVGLNASSEPAFRPLPHLEQLLAVMNAINKGFAEKGGGPMSLLFNGNYTQPALWVHTTMLAPVLHSIVLHICQ
eukprot:CAMPEP_0117659476 /NCGR_PEP_ID=MMETSP0804-20121206/6455_1 /TAXON_ID=1074897 /ORGANISM="Tetraselmis astigmatica, Strain CCMP880" /LENGTH=1346 /DNA_ID=CAMNT_0005466141 /DNA_START=348 /DNA_END=4385 /DNA_ORIENTATION=-